MRPRKTKYALQEGKFTADGLFIPVDFCLVAVCLVADGQPLTNGPLPDETGARIMRVAGAMGMVYVLEQSGLLMDGTSIFMDDDESKPEEEPAPSTAKLDELGGRTLPQDD